MAAHYIRISLLIELIAYGAVAVGAHVFLGWSYLFVAAGAMAASIASRLLFVVAGVVISNAARSPRRREHRIGPIRALVLLLREFRSVIATNYWLFPWDGLALRPDAPAAPTPRIPVLFVHGYFSNRGYFHALVPRLERLGVAPIFAPNFPSAFNTIETFAAALHAEIERVCTATGHPQLVLVCHSMGGLAARTYMCDHGVVRVRKLITIGSPHHGTVIANFGAGANAVQMRPGSDYLMKLGDREGPAGPRCPTTSIYMPHDNLVAPQDSSILPRARNVAIPGRGHVDVLESKRLVELLFEELRAADAGTAG